MLFIRPLILVVFLFKADFSSARSTKQSDGEASLNQKTLVITSVSILSQITKELAQDDFQIQSLISETSDEHHFEPSPNSIKLIQKSQILILNGLNLEPWSNSIIKNYKGLLVYASKGITHTNPHAWLSPLNGILYIDNISNALSQAKPEIASQIKIRSENLKTKLLHLHNDSLKKFKSISQRKLVTSHASFEYLAKDYNLEIYSPYNTGNEHEVSAKNLKSVIEQVRKEKIKAIFAEANSTDSTINTISKETLVPINGVLYSDKFPTDNASIKTYYDLLKYNIETIYKALAPVGLTNRLTRDL